MMTPTSAFNAATTKTFWETGTHMAMPEDKRKGLKDEGITMPEDLFEYSKDDIKDIFAALKKLIGKIVNIVHVPKLPYTLSAKSKKLIIVAANATRYYTQVGRKLTTINMHWKTLSNFDIKWKAMEELKKQDDPDAPNMEKKGSIIKWIESFKLHLNAVVGVRMWTMT